MKRLVTICLIFVFTMHFLSSLVYAADSSDKDSRIAITIGAVFGAWLGSKLFFKKNAKQTESSQNDGDTKTTGDNSKNGEGIIMEQGTIHLK